MEMRCAGCGCLVDAGDVVERCGTRECCCTDLPDKGQGDWRSAVPDEPGAGA